MWLNRDDRNNSLVVFVHGLFGDPFTSWEGAPRVLQDEMRYDPFISSYDMYLFKYPTTRRQQPAVAPVITSMLGTFLDEVESKYRTVAIVAHSQGGIIAKLLILDRLQAGMEKPPIELVVTLGTPHRGRKLAAVGFFKQVRQLAPWSANIRRLKREWGPPNFCLKDCEEDHEHRRIESIAVWGAEDRLVSQRSASGFRIDTPNSYLADHSELAKADAVTYVARKYLKQHRNPRDLIELTRTIRANATERARFMREHKGAISKLVKRARPGEHTQAADEKAASILTDFLVRFPRRPLRNVSLDEAVLTYAERDLAVDVG